MRHRLATAFIIVATTAFLSACSGVLDRSCGDWYHEGSPYRHTKPTSVEREKILTVIGNVDSSRRYEYFTDGQGYWHVYTYENDYQGVRYNLHKGQILNREEWICLQD